MNIFRGSWNIELPNLGIPEQIEELMLSNSLELSVVRLDSEGSWGCIGQKWWDGHQKNITISVNPKTTTYILAPFFGNIPVTLPSR
jgi:hypothetical protein